MCDSSGKNFAFFCLSHGYFFWCCGLFLRRRSRQHCVCISCIRYWVSIMTAGIDINKWQEVFDLISLGLMMDYFIVVVSVSL